MRRVFLELEQAKALYEDGDDIVKSILEKTWTAEELKPSLVKFENIGEIEGYKIDGTVISNELSKREDAKFVFKDISDVSHAIAIAKLSQLFHVYEEYTDIRWDDDEIKYCIIRVKNELLIVESKDRYEFIAFNNFNFAKDFCFKYKDIIIDYFSFY